MYGDIKYDDVSGEYGYMNNQALHQQIFWRPQTNSNHCGDIEMNTHLKNVDMSRGILKIATLSPNLMNKVS